MITTQRQDILVPWLCQRIGYVPSMNMKCIGSLDARGMNLRGVVGYDGYNGKCVQMQMAGEPGWIDKAVLFAAFDYPFNELDCAVVFGAVPSDNATALNINRRLGFETIIEVPDAHPDGSLILMMMRRENCKWIGSGRMH